MNESPSSHRLLLIANPISGGGRGRDRAERLQRALTDRGVTAEVFLTGKAGDGGERAARTATDRPRWSGIVVLGGDGTVNEVLNGMPDVTLPLAVVPVGTANVLAAELRMPRDPDAIADVLVDAIVGGRQREIAVATGNGRRFLLFVGAGLDGAIVRRLEQVRTGTLGKHKWIGPLLHTVWHWPRPRLRVTLDDGEVLDALSTVLVTRVTNYGGIMTMPAADLDSGRLHVLCFRMPSRAACLYHGLRATLGRLRPGPHLTIRACERLRIDGVAPYQIDGDFGGDSPLEIALLPQRARMMAPMGRVPVA